MRNDAPLTSTDSGDAECPLTCCRPELGPIKKLPQPVFPIVGTSPREASSMGVVLTGVYDRGPRFTVVTRQEAPIHNVWTFHNVSTGPVGPIPMECIYDDGGGPTDISIGGVVVPGASGGGNTVTYAERVFNTPVHFTANGVTFYTGIMNAGLCYDIYVNY